MTRFALTLEYDGGPFMGLQRQAHGPSVQQALEEAAQAITGETITMADAMYAPVCTRFETYDVALDTVCAGYRDRILALPYMREWTEAALKEPDEVEELDVEF